MTEQAREKKREYMRERQAKNKERRKKYMQEWRSNNKEKVRGYNERYWERQAADQGRKRGIKR